MYSSDTARASVLAALMLLFLWPAAQAQSVSPTLGTADVKATDQTSDARLGGQIVLLDQTDDFGSGFQSQFNASPANASSDVTQADDFTIPNGLTWTIERIVQRGFYLGGATTGSCQRANVTIWSDNGMGAPGAQLFNFDDIVPDNDTAAAGALGSLVFDITPTTLSSGTYWYSTVCEGATLNYSAFTNTGGRFLVQFNNNGGLGDPSVVRNIAGIYGLGSGWVPTTTFFGQRFDLSFGFIGQQSGTALFPQLAVEQSSLQATTPPGGTATRILTLRNVGTDDLEFVFPEYDNDTKSARGLPTIRFENYPTLNPPRDGSVFDRSGTDLFGYQFKDDDEPGGPTANFIDISGSGMEITDTDWIPTSTFNPADEGYFDVALPFTFPFYGDDKTSIRVNTNGFGSFDGNALNAFGNTTIPNVSGPEDLIAPYWDDMDLSRAGAGSVFYGAAPDGRFVIQWQNAQRFTGAGTITFQMILGDDGSIEFQYAENSLATANSATVGIENADATDGLQISFNEAGYIVAGRAILIDISPFSAEFVTDVSPASGTLAPGEDVNVTVTFDADGFDVGQYINPILLSTNDAANADVQIPATLFVVGPPEIFVDPLLLEATLDSGETETRPITITNTGLEDLEFSFLGYSALNVPADQRAPANYGPRTASDFAKGEDPASRGGAQSFDAGGPDAFGYVWIDSNESGGPAFDYTDISGTGTALALGDDEGVSVPLPFPFEFYGDSKSDVTVSSNGYLTFGTFGSDLSNDPIPAAATPNDLIAVLWDDLNPAAANSLGVFTQDMGDGRFIVQWSVTAFAGSVRFDAQAILFADGSIEFQYSNVDEADVLSTTVGIENADGTDGLQIAFDQAYLEDGLAIRIEAPSRLVTSVSPASGTVAPGESVTVTATLSAEELFAGSYTSDLSIASNDPVRPITVIDVVLTVTGDPDLVVDPMAIAFGEVFQGDSATETVTITNTGSDALTITSISSDNGLFTVSGLSGTTVAPGATATFNVTFTPTVLAASSGTITVSTNAGDREISVTGVASPASVMSVTPESLEFTVAVGNGNTASQTLTLQNDGVGVGTYTVTTSSSGDVTSGPATAELADGAGQGLSFRGTQALLNSPVESTGTRTLRTGDSVTITHSESQAIVPATGISCPTVPNAHFRVFDLSDFDIDGTFNVTNVQFGIESMSVQETTQLILYTLDGTFVRANLTEVSRVNASVGPGDDLSIVSFDIEGEFDADDVLVVEWFVPSARPFFGGNGAGESSPTYLQADGCNVFEPTPLTDLGNFPANHWVLNVTGEVGGGGAADYITVSPASGSVQPAANQELVVTVDATGLEPGTYEAVIDIDTNDPMNPTLTVPVTVIVGTGVANEAGVVPTEFSLDSSAPNPSVGQTSLRYAVPETSDVLIEVYDLMGRRVATLVDGEQTAGRKTVEWNAGSLAGGVYVYRMTAGSFASTMKMVVVR